MNKIENFTDHLECPVVDGIIFPDGTIHLLNVKVNRTNSVNYSVAAGLKTSLAFLKENNELWWGSCAIMCALIDKQLSIEVIAGEASYGSDGFVCVSDLHSKKMIWMAFFTNSNPFKQLNINREYLTAISTLDFAWRFDINNPVNCTVMHIL